MGKAVYGAEGGDESYPKNYKADFEIAVGSALAADRSNGTIDHDGQLDSAELERFLEGFLGKDVTRQQVQQLIKIYGADGWIPEDTVVTQMTQDGFLTRNVQGVRVANWDNIDGSRIAAALFREINLDPAFHSMTEAQFVQASKSLFGDKKGLSDENAGFLTRSFGTANTLRADDLAKVYDSNAVHIDGVESEGYTRVFVNMKADNSPFRDAAQADNYIMSFDGNADGMINADEFKAALQSRKGNGINVSDAAIAQYMSYYGFYDGGGQRVLNRQSIKDMLAETSLYLCDRGDHGAQGFGINLNITSPERIIRSSAETDLESTNAGSMSADELVRMFAAFGLDVTKEQAVALTRIYGDGTHMTLTDVQPMRDDGFFTPGTELGQGATLVWDNIDGKLIAAAVFRETGADPNGRVTSDTFHEGVKKLFGDVEGYTLQDAVAQNRAVGLLGTLSLEEMGQIFDSPSIHIDGVRGEHYVRVSTNVKENLPVTDDSRMLRYILSFDVNGDSILQPDELETALKSWGQAGAKLDKGMVERLSRLYSLEGVDGKGGLSIADLDRLIADKVLMAGGDKGAGFWVNLQAVPTDRLVDRIFELAGKNPATDKLTARDLDNGTDQIFGDWKPLRKHSAEELAKAYGDNESHLERGQVYDIFASGAIQRGGVGDRSFLPITVHLDIAQQWAKDKAANDLVNPGRQLLGTPKNPAETFQTKPDLFGIYKVGTRFDDGTSVSMLYEGTSLYPLFNEYQVKGAEIQVAGPNKGKVLVTRADDGTWAITSKDPNVQATLSKVPREENPNTLLDVLTIAGPNGTEKHFILLQAEPVQYFGHKPNGVWLASERYETPDDPKDDLAVKGISILGSSKIKLSSGISDVVAFEIELADGTKKKIYVEKSETRTPEQIKSLVLQLAVKYGKLTPELRGLIKETPIVISNTHPSVPKAIQAVDRGSKALLIFEPSLVGKEFENQLVHELGHLVDSDIPTPYWRTAINEDSRAVSLYARTKPAEDFAETFRIWFLIRTGAISGRAAEKLEEQMKHRFYLLDRSQSAVATLPPGLRTNPIDGPVFTPDSPRKMYNPSWFDRLTG